jgi:type VI secretion system secreted protein Hcp
MILVKIEGINGDSNVPGFKGYFTAESFSFGVERELAESSKAGTADINIGVGECQECTISKSMDITSPYLAKKAISGSSCGTAEIKFVETITRKNNEMFNVVYLAYKLDNVFIKSWSTSGDADDRPTEDVAIWYNKIAFAYYSTSDGMEFKFAGDCKWDQTKSKPWSECSLPQNAEEHKAS